MHFHRLLDSLCFAFCCCFHKFSLHVEKRETKQQKSNQIMVNELLEMSVSEWARAQAHACSRTLKTNHTHIIYLFAKGIINSNSLAKCI